jgi:hypothetical protein
MAVAAAAVVYAFVVFTCDPGGRCACVVMRIALALAMVSMLFPLGMRALRAEGNDETLPCYHYGYGRALAARGDASGARRQFGSAGAPRR